MDVHVAVDGQRMTFLDSGYRFAPHSQKFIKFQFDLSDDWSELTVFAQWTQNGHSYNSYLDSEHCVYLPSEIMSGECSMMLYGTGTSGEIGTTNAVKLCIATDAFVADGQSTVITQSLYDQLVAIVQVATLAEAKEYLGI